MQIERCGDETIRETIVAHHYLHRWPATRSLPFGYRLLVNGTNAAPDGRPWGVLLFKKPQHIRQSGLFGSVNLPTAWQVLDLARVWVHPDLQVHWEGLDRAGRVVQHSPCAFSRMVNMAFKRLDADWIAFHPPVFLDQPYHIELVISYAELAHHDGVSYRAAGLLDYGLTSDGTKRVFIKHIGKSPTHVTEGLSTQITSAYATGGSIACVAKTLGVGRGVVWSVLRHQGVQRTPRKCKMPHDVNEHAFDVPSPDANYWAGFMMADGFVASGFVPSVGTCLAIIDQGHVGKLRDFIAPSGKVNVWNRKHPCASFRTRSQLLADGLAKYGVTPQKTFTAKAADFVLNDRDFWRGVVDGDGWISFGAYYKIGLCGSRFLMDQFADYCLSILKTDRPIVKPHKSIFKLNISGVRAQEIIKALYDGATVFLDRKMATAKAAISHVPRVAKEKIVRTNIPLSTVVEYAGESLPIHAMAKKHGLTPICLKKRLEKATPIADAINAPKAKRGGKAAIVEWNGEKGTVKDFCKKANIDPYVVYQRIELGWDLNTALTTPARKWYAENDK